MSAKGFEPLTNGLKGHCSAVELRAQNAGIVSRAPLTVNYEIKLKYTLIFFNNLGISTR